MQFAALIGGFIALFGLDVMFFRHSLTSVWWLKLRELLEILVLVCLSLTRYCSAVGVYFSVNYND